MRGLNHNFAASDDFSVAILSLAVLIIGFSIAAIAVWKYLRGEIDNAIILGALATAIMFMASGVLSK